MQLDSGSKAKSDHPPLACKTSTREQKEERLWHMCIYYHWCSFSMFRFWYANVCIMAGKRGTKAMLPVLGVHWTQTSAAISHCVRLISRPASVIIAKADAREGGERERERERGKKKKKRKKKKKNGVAGDVQEENNREETQQEQQRKHRRKYKKNIYIYIEEKRENKRRLRKIQQPRFVNSACSLENIRFRWFFKLRLPDLSWKRLSWCSCEA